MKPEEQRIAIAEVCGWKFSDRALRWPDGSICATDEDPSTTIETFSYLLPDYLNDLNAMHEAENWLKTNHIKLWVSQYWQNILSVCNCDKDDGMLQAIHASAAQRSEAFLRTIGKWTEQQLPTKD